jgi:hypothetical protein
MIIQATLSLHVMKIHAITQDHHISKVVVVNFKCHVPSLQCIVVIISTQKKFGLGVQRQSLIAKRAGDSDKKEKCPFSHYGFLLVEWFCQNGIPLKHVYECRDRLIGQDAVSTLFVQERREQKQLDNPELFQCLPTGEHVAVKDRELKTWFPNRMLSQFLLDSKVQFPILEVREAREQCT